MNIGIVGTGLIGSQIALRLAHKGHKVMVFNRNKSKAEKLRSANGLVQEKANLVVIQCSTIAPDESHRLTGLYTSKKVKILSVPILGGISAAESGELILIAAGDKTDYDQSESILKDISKQVFYIGSNHGTASILNSLQLLLHKFHHQLEDEILLQ